MYLDFELEVWKSISNWQSVLNDSGPTERYRLRGDIE